MKYACCCFSSFCWCLWINFTIKILVKKFNVKQHVVCWILFVVFASDHHRNDWILNLHVHHSLHHFDRNGHQHCYCLVPFVVWWLVLAVPAAVGMGFETIQYPNGYRFLNIPVNNIQNKWQELKWISCIKWTAFHRWHFNTYLRAVN